MSTRRVIFTVSFIIVLFATPIVVRSYSLVDLANDTNLEYTDENGQCSSVNIGNIVDRFNNDYAQKALERAKDVFKNIFSKYPEQVLMCVTRSLLVFGGGVSGALSCPSDVGSSMTDEAIYQLEHKFENDLITDCTAQSDIRNIFNDSRRILAENGRNGGAAYVQDWRAFQADNRYRGLQIARNEMANTKHCPWVSSQLQGLFNYDPSKAVAPIGGNEDGQDSYIQNAQCTLPDDFNPGAEKYQTAAAFAALMQPQNNIWGSYMLAQEEVNKQIADEERAAQNEFVNTGGFGGLRDINPQTGNSCAVMAADGSTCLQYTKIVQPGGGVVAEVQAQRQAQYDLITNPRTNEQTANNVQRDLVSTFMSIEQPMPQFQYRQQRTTGAPPSPTPTPKPTNVPGSGDPGDPVCTGGIPACHCAINNPSEQQLANTAVKQATLAAIAASQIPLTGHDYLDPLTGAVRPGMNVPFLQLICDQDALKGIGGCRPNNAGFGLVLTMDPLEVNVDVLLPNNVIRIPGVLTVVCSSTGNL